MTPTKFAWDMLLCLANEYSNDNFTIMFYKGQWRVSLKASPTEEPGLMFTGETLYVAVTNMAKSLHPKWLAGYLNGYNDATQK